MGVIKRGILGGFSNKVGPIVGSSWKGVDVVRSMPLSVANPRTPAQTAQRTKFKTISQLASSLLASIVKPLWDRDAKLMSGYNAFIRENIENVTPELQIAPNSLIISKGTIGETSFEIEHSPGDTFYIANWELAAMPANGKDTDIFYGVALDTTNAKAYAFETGKARNEQSAMVQLDAEILPTITEIIGAFKSADGLTQSNSVIVPISG